MMHRHHHPLDLLSSSFPSSSCLLHQLCNCHGRRPPPPHSYHPAGTEAAAAGLVKDEEGRDVALPLPPTLKSDPSAAAADSGDASAPAAAAPAAGDAGSGRGAAPASAAAASDSDCDVQLVEYQGMLVTGSAAQRRGEREREAGRAGV